jgi:conjugative relaxase-like TrwC/TraI family protein
MYDGFAPDGPKVRNAGMKSHFPGQDVTNTWPKAFGVLCYSLRDPNARADVERCGWEANLDSLQLFEDTGAWTRLGKGGHFLAQATGIVAGIIPHLTSRGVHDGVVDINPHYHNLVFTPVSCSDGVGRAMLGITQTTKAKSPVQSRSALYTLKKTLGATFAEGFARRVAALGYPVERTVDGSFTIRGVPDELCEFYSSRSKQIRADMARRKVSGPREAARSNKRTRGAKTSVNREELLQRWQQVAESRGFDPAKLRVNAPTRIQNPLVPAELRARVADIAAAKARMQFQASPRASEHTKDISRALSKQPESERPLAADHGANGRARRPSDHRAARKQSEAEDMHTLRAAAAIAGVFKRARRDGGHVLTRTNVAVAAKQHEYLQRSKLTPEEKSLLYDITRRCGSIQFVGGASATKVISIANTGWKREGKRILLATPSKANAERLERETGVHSISLSGLEQGLRTNRGILGGLNAALHKADSMLPFGFKSTGGFIGYALAAAGRWIRLDKHCVVIVDRADFLELPERSALVRHIQRSGAKLVFMDQTRDASDVAAALLRRPRAAERIGPEQREEQHRIHESASQQREEHGRTSWTRSRSRGR